MFPVVAHSVCNTKEKWTITWRHDDGQAASDDGEVEKAIDEGAHTKYCRVFYVLYVYVLLGCAVILCEWVPSHNPSTQSLSLYGPLSLSLSRRFLYFSCFIRSLLHGKRLLNLIEVVANSHAVHHILNAKIHRVFFFFSSYFREYDDFGFISSFFLHFLGCCHFASRAYMTKKIPRTEEKKCALNLRVLPWPYITLHAQCIILYLYFPPGAGSFAIMFIVPEP